MRKSIIKFLTCPVCRSNFVVVIHKETKEKILEGELKCQRCDREFYIKNEIAYFTPCIKKQFEKDARKLRKVTTKQEIPKKWRCYFSRQELVALKKEWQWMLSSIKKNKKAIHLDFATGTGRFLRNIVSKTKGEIVALDNGCGTCQELQYFLKRIKKYSRVSIVCADARSMPFKNSAFDNVSSWHGLDESKMIQAIKEAKRVLKKEGYFVASGVHYLKGSKSFLRAQKHHINFLTKEIAVKALKKIGFRNIQHKVFFEGQWNEKESYLPIFNDFYSVYGIRAKK